MSANGVYGGGPSVPRVPTDPYPPLPSSRRKHLRLVSLGRGRAPSLRLVSLGKGRTPSLRLVSLARGRAPSLRLVSLGRGWTSSSTKGRLDLNLQSEDGLSGPGGRTDWRRTRRLERRTGVPGEAETESGILRDRLFGSYPLRFTPPTPNVMDIRTGPVSWIHEFVLGSTSTLPQDVSSSYRC